MFTSEKLLKALRVGNIEQGDLLHVLGRVFHTSRQIGPREIVYGDDPVRFALKLTYKADGSLTEISPGPKFSSDDLEQLTRLIESSILANAGQRIATVALFSDSRVVRGYFRYHDLLQILPAPPQAPRPIVPVGQFPFLLQFGYPASQDVIINARRITLRRRELELLLATVLEGNIQYLGAKARFHWVFLPPLSDRLVASYCQEGYLIPDFGPSAEVFFPVDSLGPMAGADSAFYGARPVPPGADLEIPPNLVQILDAYFSLSPEDRDKFFRASYWFQYSHVAFPHSVSASFMAMVSAVEAVMPPDKRDEVCKSCNRSMKGPTRLFREFVDQFAPGSTQNSKFFATRSGLSHGGSLLYFDREDLMGGHAPELGNQRAELTELFWVVRSVLLKWLASSAPAHS